MLDDQEFRLRADEALERLYRTLADASDEYGFETDLGGALTVEFEDPPTRFVISPNAPVKQIWVSANVKSYKLDWDPDLRAFALKDSGETLAQVVAAAVSKVLGEEIKLDA